MRSLHRGPRFLQPACIGPFAAVCVMVVVVSCSRPPSYTIVELGESMTMKEEAVLDARSLHPPGDLGAEEWVVPSATVALSADRFVVAAMQPFGVVLYDLAAATLRLVPLAFGQGPQELEEIDDLLVSDGGFRVFDASRRRHVEFTSAGEFVRTDVFPRPVLAKAGPFAVCRAFDDGATENGYLVGVLTRWGSFDSVVREIRVPSSALAAGGVSTETPREFLSWHVAASESVVVIASEFFDIVGVIQPEPFSASWFLLEDHRGSVERTRRESLERDHPAVLIASVEVTASGRILLGRGIGRLAQDGRANYQIDVFDLSMRPQSTIVVQSKPDIIAAGRNWLVVGSRPPRQDRPGFTAYEQWEREKE